MARPKKTSDASLISEPVSQLVRELLTLSSLTRSELAQVLGASLVVVDRWERGDVQPSTQYLEQICKLLNDLRSGKQAVKPDKVMQNGFFASRGSSRSAMKIPSGYLFPASDHVGVSPKPLSPILERLKDGRFFVPGVQALAEILKEHVAPAKTPSSPMSGSTSAGKNTYTYDAHTYHTKVPPQGIVDFLQYYLPEGGLVLDPFSGSGMTGVAARASGFDVILNELSPAACFISHNFTEVVDTNAFVGAFRSVMSGLSTLRRNLYTTECRECGKDTEILYMVWSYRVLCSHCDDEFVLWDHCRRYGRSVKEHKILSEFLCPSCNATIKKRTLKRTHAVPVLLAYKCCQKKQVEHRVTVSDLDRIKRLETEPMLAEGFFPTTPIPDGANLNQPKRHGLDRIDRFYTPRNLSALSNIWKEIHRIEHPAIAGVLAFAFTSLYQRVSRLSEFRFWGGSSNTAHFNVPFIFNEANVFSTFERKAASIVDHLETTAFNFRGKKVVVQNSATNLDYLPDGSIDFIFTDPPFGGNINYSDMNILWESWLGEFTDTTHEAIINRYQGKAIAEYQSIMMESLSECYRVLRPGHWMSLVFMNSSAKVWDALQQAVEQAGFALERMDIFDKQHGTFKQFVSDNATGCDLVLHCRKPVGGKRSAKKRREQDAVESIKRFLASRNAAIPITMFHHVLRERELDLRMLYSEWVSFGLLKGHKIVDFSAFRDVAIKAINENYDGKDK
jgi:DNA modification methylase/transcriptional regulator with XRE-family HTH domain